jgi:hypothetical protein
MCAAAHRWRARQKPLLRYRSEQINPFGPVLLQLDEAGEDGDGVGAEEDSPCVDSLFDRALSVVT